MPKSNKKINKNTNKNKREIYLDYAASVYPNPSSIHASGVRARAQLESARGKVAEILDARGPEIVFTSGGTESNNLAIHGVVWAWYKREKVSYVRHRKSSDKPHIITTNIEHPSVLETCRMLKARGLAQISIVPVEYSGIVDPKKIYTAIKKNTVLVSVMYANNEIGTIQPTREIAKLLRRYRKENLTQPPCVPPYQGEGHSSPLIRGGQEGLKRCTYPLFHTDAVQAVNYLDINVGRLGVDMLSISGSKIGGLEAGVGVLYKKKSVELSGVFGGGDQELGLRPGTENLAGILRFAKALWGVGKNKTREVKRLTRLRDYFISKINKISQNQSNKFILNGDLEHCLPNIVNITIPKISADLLVLELSERGIMASSKSACKSGEVGGSYVIEAIRRQKGQKSSQKSDLSHSDSSHSEGLRFSMGEATTRKDLDLTIRSLQEILKKLKKWY